MIQYKSISEEWIAAKVMHINCINTKTYYDSLQDSKKQDDYYSNINFELEDLCVQLCKLLENTHTSHLKYSPHQYVYPWVDLHENLQIKSLYSGQNLDPLKMIEDDLKLLRAMQDEGISISEMIIFNCEHVVPQSWFDGNEPMRGDLHHLFACEPACNSMRSNYPYYDFVTYSPEFTAEGIRTGCGMAENQKFEPEYSKGIAARAAFYFSLRYKHVIRLEDKMDLKLLLRWHLEHPITLYEKHRNAAIQELQGNRNPFIDFPEAAREMLKL